MNDKELIDYLNELVKQEGGQANLAKRLGISRAYLNDVIHGRRAPGSKILKALGLKKTISYERIN